MVIVSLSLSHAATCPYVQTRARGDETMRQIRSRTVAVSASARREYGPMGSDARGRVHLHFALLAAVRRAHQLWPTLARAPHVRQANPAGGLPSHTTHRALSCVGGHWILMAVNRAATRQPR